MDKSNKYIQFIMYEVEWIALADIFVVLNPMEYYIIQIAILFFSWYL